VLIESLVHDLRYAIRGIRRSPLFAASVAATIGLGLGILCSAFTILNTYLLRPIDLPDAHELYSLSWDTETTQRRRFSLADFDDLRQDAPPFSGLVAGQEVLVMQDEVPLSGLLVPGNYFQVLGGRPALGRWLAPADATVPGSAPVVVLSHGAWRARFGADPSIVGKQITLGRQRFDVVGVAPPGFGLRSEVRMTFWAPLTMARAFSAPDPSAPSLVVVGRLRQGVTDTQARAWLDVWLRQRFTAGSEAEPIAVRVEFEGRRLAVNPLTVTLLALLGSAFSLVLLVACANVTNLLLARALGRQRDIGVRLSLGASRWRVARQLTIESLVLAVPAAAVGLALTLVTARVFPPLIVSTIPKGIGSIEALMVPLEPDIRVMALLFVAAVASAVLVTLAPAARVTRMNLVWASRGETAMDTRRSRLRTGLVAMQIGACVLFIVCASGLIEESQRLANPDPGISYERVTDVRLAPPLRSEVATRLTADPAIERVAAAWRAPLDGPLPPIGVVASQTRTEQTAGFMVVSPEYFPLFDIRVVRGRAFTALEADEGAPVVLVSEATARTLWPGLDPIGQTLNLVPSRGRRANRRPAHTSVRVIGVTEDVVSGMLMNGVDATCVYFATGLDAPGELSILVRTRGDASTARTSVAAAVNAIEPDAPFQAHSLHVLLGLAAWAFQAFSVTASILGAVGLVLAFSGTYAVVAFLVTQRRREFGIRMALGATVRQIVSGILGDTLRTAAIGLGAGLAVSMSLVRFFSGTIPIIPTYSLRTYVVGTSIVLVATVIAALLPSLRATQIDPSRALRVE
jgi:predicted permease